MALDLFEVTRLIGEQLLVFLFIEQCFRVLHRKFNLIILLSLLVNNFIYLKEVVSRLIWPATFGQIGYAQRSHSLDNPRVKCLPSLPRLRIDRNTVTLLLLMVFILIHRTLGCRLLPERGRIIGLVIDTQTLLEEARFLNLLFI